MSANTNQPTKKYIVTNEQGEEFLLPKYAATFRILMDDKDTIMNLTVLLISRACRKRNESIVTMNSRKRFPFGFVMTRF